MKRVFSALAVILLVAVCVVPVMAAESFLFDYYDLAYLPEFPSSGNGARFSCPCVLASGYYDIEYCFNGAVSFLSDVYIELSPSSSLANTDVATVYLSKKPDFIYFQVYVYYDDNSTVLQVMKNYNYFKASAGDYILLTPLVFPETPSFLVVSDLLLTIMGVVLEVILENWFTALLLALSLLGLGVVAIRKLKRP